MHSEQNDVHYFTLIRYSDSYQITVQISRRSYRAYTCTEVLVGTFRAKRCTKVPVGTLRAKRCTLLYSSSLLKLLSNNCLTT